MEWAFQADKLIGFILGVITLLTLLGRWFWKRIKTQVDTNVSDLKTGHTDIARRLQSVENDLVGVQTDVGTMSKRIGGLETRIGSLASKDDVHALAIKMASIDATVGQTSNKVDSLYRGVLARAEKGS